VSSITPVAGVLTYRDAGTRPKASQYRTGFLRKGTSRVLPQLDPQLENTDFGCYYVIY
jgi:hypothetical protein